MFKNIKQRKKEFFEWRNPGISNDDLSSAGGSRFESHLGDFAARHPELADHLHGFPISRKFGTIPREQGNRHKDKGTAQSNLRTEATKPPETSSIGTQTAGLESDIKLRNTVPDMQASTGETVDGDRGQRSQSAPPQAPSNAKQKEEGVRLIPIKTDGPSAVITPPGPQIPRPAQHFQQQHPQFPVPSQHFNQPQHHHFTDQSASQHQEESKGPTVRHIPIFVEGRDEPILPKDIGPSNVTKRGGCQGKTESAPSKRVPDEKKEHHSQSREQTQETQTPPQQQTQTPSQPPPPQKPDPLTLVANIMKEVEDIAVKVEEWKGNSRSDKEYIFLDEMLTRNLLKLDNIETEGRDEVRMARKDAIKRINAAISILEAKASPEETAMAVHKPDGSSNTNHTKAGMEVADGTDIINHGESIEVTPSDVKVTSVTTDVPMEAENTQAQETNSLQQAAQSQN